MKKIDELHPRSSFSREEAVEFNRLLQKLKEDGGIFPTIRSWRMAEASRVTAAPEIVVPRFVKKRPMGGRREILLTLYNGDEKSFRGKWHIPGSWGKPAMGNTLPEMCSSIAEAELGVDVTYVRTFDQPFLWPPREVDPVMGHPFGRPLSLYVLCEPREEVLENEKRRFFSRRNLPENVVAPHLKFILEEPYFA